MAYLIDANVLIEAKNRYYGFDFHPGFWDWLLAANRNGHVFSIEKVAEELRAGGDELTDWVRQRDAGFFLPPDGPVTVSLQACSTWVNDCGLYEPPAIATWLGEADYYLVAHAHAHQNTVVTHEVASVSRNIVKIPDACAGMGVPCVTGFEMLSASGAVFVVRP
jgi:hypothetical protein